MLPNHSITSGSYPNIGKRKYSLTQTNSSKYHDTNDNSNMANDCVSNKRVNQPKSRKECDQHIEINRLNSQLASTQYSRSNESHRLEEEVIRLEDCQIRNRQAMLQTIQATNRIECDQHNEIN